MKCAICGIEIETIQEAMEQGWRPSFYEGEMEHGPMCSSWVETITCVGEDGEMELKAEYFGKIQYVDGDYRTQNWPEDLEIEILIAQKRKE